MNILLVEDDRDLCQAVRIALEQEGYQADLCHNGEDGLYMAREGVYDCLLLDRMLPELDGIELLKKLRAQGNGTPVIFLTALNGVGDRVEGLDNGADDYLVKPFAIEELLARLRALLRRPKQWETTRRLTLSQVELEPDSAILRGNGKSCTLSRRECQLLEFFLCNPEKILPREVLLARVWGPEANVEDGNLDNYIHFLRRRLKAVGADLQIKTVRSVGYVLEKIS